MFNKLKERFYRKKGQKLLAQRQPAKAHNFLVKALDLNGSAENLFNLGLSNMAQFRYQEAEELLFKVYDLLPENEVNILALLETLLLQRKWTKLEEMISKNQKFFSSSAFKKYAELALDPVEREKYAIAKEKYNLGFKELENNNKAAALQYLQSALDYFGKSTELLQNIGVLHWENGNYQEAFNSFQKALSLDPGNLQLQKLLIKTKRKLS